MFIVVLIDRTGNSVSCSSKMPKGDCLNIKEKSSLPQEVDNCDKKKAIALKFYIPSNSLSTIIKSRDKLQNCDSSNSSSKHLRKCANENGADTQKAR
ncbi:hypothetical protein TNCV_434051 [Trichonephila clavipes]|nr:hypothetical protein TNCV_434051 [Trichonephila clavipes]